MITAFAMAVGAGALIVVMSTFNGFEDLVKSLYKVFYTDIVILPAEGKFFETDGDFLQKLDSTQGIISYSQVLEENVLAEYQGRQSIVTMKGVDDNYYKVVDDLDNYLYNGSLDLKYEGAPLAVLGSGIAYRLGVNLMMPNTVLTFYMPRSDKSALNDVANAFKSDQIYAHGIFAVQQDFDDKYILVPIDFAKNLMEMPSKISSIEIKLEKNVAPEKIQTLLQKKLGSKFTVQTRYEQNATLYKVMKTEKWAVFAILSFIVLIAAFNIIGSLSMLVIEKKQDIATLRALGADKNTIQNIFLIEGLLISFLGAFIGLALGTIFCLLQIHIGMIKMPGSSFMVQYYPVKMQLEDFVLIAFIIITISIIMAWLPARRAVQQLSHLIPGKA
jgi:lipoprotein-releasing system permease protein